MKTLEKDRTQRYETARGLAEDIRRHLQDEPVTAARPVLSYRLKKLYRRKKNSIKAGFGIAACLLVVIAMGFSGGRLATKAS